MGGRVETNSCKVAFGGKDVVSLFAAWPRWRGGGTESRLPATPVPCPESRLPAAPVPCPGGRSTPGEANPALHGICARSFNEHLASLSPPSEPEHPVFMKIMNPMLQAPAPAIPDARRGPASVEVDKRRRLCLEDGL